MKMPMVLLRMYVEFETLKELQKMVESDEFDSVSAAGRKLIEMGIKLTGYQKIMKDPELKKKFFEELDSYMTETKIFEWVDTLEENTMKAISMAIDIRRERAAPKQEGIEV